MVQDTFRSFADNEIRPRAEHVHRHNDDVPEEIIAGLAEMGVFGLSVPAEYGGYSEGGDGEYIAMVVATEELSRGSLGIGGSLITRPEILTRALVKGGTEAQKQYWLPKLATAEVMAAVAVTEPDYGSDVAGIKVTATPATGSDGEPGYVINGVKTWCTFARPCRRADAAGPHRPGPQPRPTAASACSSCPSRAARPTASSSPSQPTTALSARWRAARSTPSATAACTATRSPSTTGGCRPTNLIGEDGGHRASGFYYQMEGFENGRLQTAARAVGVMQAAYEAAAAYAAEPQGVRLERSSSTNSPRSSSAGWRCSSRPAVSSATTSPR